MIRVPGPTIRWCTWVDCSHRGLHVMTARDGEQWADLCSRHKYKFEEAMASGKPALIVATWVKAQGGSKAAAERF